jgi:hypothetical protein
VDDLRLLGVDDHAVARQRGRGRRQVAEPRRAPAAHRGVDPGGVAVRPAGGGADVEDLRRVAAEVHLDGHERGAIGGIAAVAGRGDEEVQQHRRLAGLGDEHVAAGAGPAQQRLGDPRREHGGDRRIDRVSAGAQHVGARLRGQRMACGDHPGEALLHGTRLVGRPRALDPDPRAGARPQKPRGMNSGTSSSVTPSPPPRRAGAGSGSGSGSRAGR